MDGNDVLACLAAMRWALDNARRGNGPAFIEAVTYRMGPHTTSDDPTRYRDKDEVERWRRRDPIARVEALLRAEGGFDDDFAAEVAADADRLGAEVRAATLGATSREPIGVFDHVYAEPHSGLDEQRAWFASYLDGFAARPARGGGTMTQLTMAKAINEGLRRAMADDPKVLVMGEDIGKLGGVFRITDGLLDQFGAQRVIDTPLAESGIMGTAVGLAFRGYRPVVEIQFDGFVYPAFDQIVCQVAKLHYRTRGNVKMPITIRIPWAGGVGAAEHHSESPEAYFVHTSGLRVVAVSNPQDAYVMLRQAIASDDPVVYFEPKRLYHTKGEVDLDADLADAPPMGLARVAREGTRRHAPHLRRAGRDGAGCRDRRRGRRRLDRGHRPALDLAGRLPHGDGIRPQDRTRRRHARGGPRGGRRRRAHRERHRALLQLPRGGARARHGPRHPVPAREAREAPPSRPRPDPRRRRPRARPAEQPDRESSCE